MKSLPFISAEVIIRLKKGDEAAFRIIFDAYSPRLYYFVYRFLKEKEQTEEIVQETFLNLWTNRQKLKEEYPAGSYLFTVARRLALNKLRHEAIAGAYRENLWKNMQETHNETEEAVLLADLERFTEEGLTKLSAQQQLVFRLNRHEGLSHEEIAERLKISRNTVKNHMTQALKSLRVHFRQSGALFLSLAYYFLKNF